ncbi:MAG TPA: response regulator [Candidatus Binatia bacterium]|jgi:two-component system cell cycle response regulator DivK|nr:response regulator [Candidatus Binatia bacterium]
MIKVLIIEDNDDNRGILRQQLEYLGYEVVEASTSTEGLDQMKKENPDLVIVDVMLAGADGREVARKIRMEPKTKDVPILASTVLFQREDVRSCLDAGCNDVLSKPFTLQQLKEKLDKVSSLASKLK